MSSPNQALHRTAATLAVPRDITPLSGRGR
jgi:hypothetical protein